MARSDASRAAWLAAFLCVGTAAVAAAGLGTGHGSVFDKDLGSTLVELRASRFGAAFLAGACLAAAGAAVQGLFQNPLASPSVLGTTAGASFGGQVALLAVGFGPVSAQVVTPELMLPLGCVLGAIVSLVLLLSIVRDRTDVLTLLLSGFLLSALFLSVSGFALSTALRSYEVGRAVAAFSLGGVGATGPRQVLLAAPLVAFGLPALWIWGRPLDLLLSGAEEAASLGLNVRAAQRWVIVWVAVVTAAAVALAGNVSFVGLVIPHALRPWIGPAHRPLIAVSAIGGGLFVSLADLSARLIPSTSEVPLGVITGLIGAPTFLWMLRRARPLDG